MGKTNKKEKKEKPGDKIEKKEKKGAKGKKDKKTETHAKELGAEDDEEKKKKKRDKKVKVNECFATGVVSSVIVVVSQSGDVALHKPSPSQEDVVTDQCVEFHLGGFQNAQLNGIYSIDSTMQVNNKKTYWGRDRGA